MTVNCGLNVPFKKNKIFIFISVDYDDRFTHYCLNCKSFIRLTIKQGCASSCQKYKEVRDQCEAVKKRGEEIKKMTMERQSQEGLGWWEVPIGDLNRNELQELRLKLEELKKNITDELASRASTPTAFSADSIA
ncbi:hypothetical protein L1049_024632 [Liquidambar formosana]|uniref:Uncharacterized protein n=1 Tax=Liquidambar formosana TaxID=63359 RepID=A0AAP0S1U6_LIQFO